MRDSEPIGSTPRERVTQTIEAYDRHAREYSTRYMGVDLSVYIHRFAKSLPGDGDIVLDVGSGSGRDLAQFERLHLRTVGLDRSWGLAIEGRRNASGAQFVLGDARQLPFREGAFAGIWCCATLLHLNEFDVAMALREFHRVLVDGGVLFLSMADGHGEEARNADVGQVRWFYYYSEENVRSLVNAAGLKIVDLSTEAGVAHGRWVNVMARK